MTDQPLWVAITAKKSNEVSRSNKFSIFRGSSGPHKIVCLEIPWHVYRIFEKSKFILVNLKSGILWSKQSRCVMHRRTQWPLLSLLFLSSLSLLALFSLSSLFSRVYFSPRRTLPSVMFWILTILLVQQSNQTYFTIIDHMNQINTKQLVRVDALMN